MVFFCSYPLDNISLSFYLYNTCEPALRVRQHSNPPQLFGASLKNILKREGMEKSIK